MRRLMAVAAVLTIGTIACDNRGMVAPGSRNPDIQHAVVLAGNGHFSFAPPLSAPATPNGAFNPQVSPVVEVCRIVLNTCPVVATFTLENGTGGSLVTVDGANELYKVNWLTTALTIGQFRISVSGASSQVEHTFLGSIDVKISPVVGPTEPPTTFASGSTVPIRFRIEEGALCRVAECVEKALDETGGSVTLDDSLAGAYFPPGSIPEAAGQVNVIIERYTDRSEACLPTNYPQYEACYRYRTEPHVTFDVPVTIGICLDPAAQSFESELELQKWNEVDPNTLVSLPRTSVDFLDCSGFQVSAAPREGVIGRLAGLGSTLILPLRRALMPAGVHASVISPYGGKLSDFSRIGWVRPLHMAAEATPSTAAPPTMRVTSTITGSPVAGVPISWTVLLGGGSVSPPNTATDATGRSSTMWTLSYAPGDNRIKATAANPKPNWPGRPGNWGEVRFDINIPVPPPPIEYHAVFLQPIGVPASGSLSWQSNATPSVAICRLSNGACIQTVTAFATTSKNLTTRSYQVTWTPAAALPLGMYRIIVSNQSSVKGSVDLQAVSTASDLSNAKFQVGKSLVIKFSLEP